MDHLLRNRRLGSLATPVSNPFFIDFAVYFLHRLLKLKTKTGNTPARLWRIWRHRCVSGKHGLEFCLDRGSEREQHQLGCCSVHRDGRTSIEVHFVPSVRDHKPSVHIGGDGGLLVGPIHPRPRFTALFRGKVAGVDEMVLWRSLGICFGLELVEFGVAHGVSKPCTLPEPG